MAPKTTRALVRCFVTRNNQTSVGRLSIDTWYNGRKPGVSKRWVPSTSHWSEYKDRRERCGMLHMRRNKRREILNVGGHGDKYLRTVYPEYWTVSPVKISWPLFIGPSRCSWDPRINVFLRHQWLSSMNGVFWWLDTKISTNQATRTSNTSVALQVHCAKTWRKIYVINHAKRILLEAHGEWRIFDCKRLSKLWSHLRNGL